MKYRAAFITVISAMFFLGSIGVNAQDALVLDEGLGGHNPEASNHVNYRKEKPGDLPKKVNTDFQKPEGAKDVYNKAREDIKDAYSRCIATRDQGRTEVAALAKTEAKSNTEAAKVSQENVSLGIETTKDYLKTCDIALKRCKEDAKQAFQYHVDALKILNGEREGLVNKQKELSSSQHSVDQDEANKLATQDIPHVDKNIKAHTERRNEAAKFQSFCVITVEKEVDTATQELLALGWTQEDLTKFRAAVANGEEDSEGGIFDFIADNPLVAVGGVAVLGAGALALGGIGGKEEGKGDEEDKNILIW